MSSRSLERQPKLDISNNMRCLSRDRALIRDRRSQIATKAVQILVKNGYEQTTVPQIAEACGMAVGTLYRYIGTKQDILYLVIEHALKETTRLTNDRIRPLIDHNDATEALRIALRLIAKLVDDIQDFTLFVYAETKRLSPAYQERILNLERKEVSLIEELLRKGCATGHFEIEDITIVAHNIIVTMQMWAVRRWFFRGRYSLEQYTEKQSELILRQIQKRKNCEIL